MPPEIAQLEERIQKLENLIGRLVLFDRILLPPHVELNSDVGTKIGLSTKEKIGFFNKTPIVQQTTSSQSPSTFAPNTSNIVDDSATWAGYTIGDIVAILRAFGLIA